MADGYGKWSMDHQPFAVSHQPSALTLYLLHPVRHGLQFGGLASVQPLRDRERRVHAHDAGVEVELGHPLEAARRALLDADAAALAVVHENLVEPVRSIEPDDARLGADQIAVVAGVALAAAEAAVRLLLRLLLPERQDHLVLPPLP